MQNQTMIESTYLAAAICFMLGLKFLSSPATARRGNLISLAGMLLAIVATLFSGGLSFSIIIAGIAVGALIGAVSAARVPMTAMPEFVALFNGAGGAASALVATAELRMNLAEHGANLVAAIGAFSMVTLLLSAIVGSLTLTGSVAACLKLRNWCVPSAPVTYPGQQAGNALVLAAIAALSVMVYTNPANMAVFWALLLISLVLGVLFVIPIGGADMPVVISLLNAYSGVAVFLTGFAIHNNALIVTGSLVGASGVYLSKIMCDAMNRSLANVLFGAFGKVDEAAIAAAEAGGGGMVKGYEAEDVANVLAGAASVIIVPGYGMAAAQAQKVVRDLADLLESRGATVRYAIHPVAGRMPGHMNVLLAEADVPYEQLFAMEDINDDFPATDVALVVGANDVVNPAAKHNPASPIYGMPVLDVDLARTIVFMKRSMRPGFAGIDNELFTRDNTMMFFGDAKKSLQTLIASLKEM